MIISKEKVEGTQAQYDILDEMIFTLPVWKKGERGWGQEIDLQNYHVPKKLGKKGYRKFKKFSRSVQTSAATKSSTAKA